MARESQISSKNILSLICLDTVLYSLLLVLRFICLFSLALSRFRTYNEIPRFMPLLYLRVARLKSKIPQACLYIHADVREYRRVPNTSTLPGKDFILPSLYSLVRSLKRYRDDKCINSVSIANSRQFLFTSLFCCFHVSYLRDCYSVYIPSPVAFVV